MGVPGGNGSSLSRAAPTGATWLGQEEPLQAVLAARWEPKFLCAEASPQATRASSHLGGGRAVTQESGPRDRKWRLQTQPGSANGSRSEL